MPVANLHPNYFEWLNDKGVSKRLFLELMDNLLEKKFIFQEGQIVDVGFVKCLDSTRKENKFYSKSNS